MNFSCPICKKQVHLGDADFPFCSERCRTMDLGAWSAEKYKVSSPAPIRENEGEPPDDA